MKSLWYSCSTPPTFFTFKITDFVNVSTNLKMVNNNNHIIHQMSQRTKVYKYFQIELYIIENYQKDYYKTYAYQTNENTNNDHSTKPNIRDWHVVLINVHSKYFRVTPTIIDSFNHLN